MNKLPRIPNKLLNTNTVFNDTAGMGGDGPVAAPPITLKAMYDDSIKKIKDSNGVEILVNGTLFYNGKPIDFKYGQNVKVYSKDNSIVKTANIIFMKFPKNPDGTTHHSEIGLGG